MKKLMLAGTVSVSLAALSSGAFAATSIGDAVIRWNEKAGVAATKACIAPLDDPFHEARIYAMMHIAIHDALNAIDRKYQPHTCDAKVESEASPDAAVAAAAHDVLVSLIGQLPPELVKKECIDAGVASAEAAYTDALADIPEAPAKTQGIAVGQASSAAIIKARVNDKATEGPFLNKNCPKPEPGKYQCTPGFPFVAFEAWANVTPFVLKDNTQFRPEPPYAITDKAFKTDLDEVKSLGGNGATTPSMRTADQNQIALMWWESSPLKWSRIARTVATDKGLDMWQNARLFAILDMALMDGYVAMSASKNFYNFWRPVTAIQSGGDANWTPFQPTPPNQDYPSGHAIEGGVGAEVLKQVFGTDEVSFQDCGTMFPPGTTCNDSTPMMRSYTRFSQAANENAYSRILIGFHFRHAIEEGNAYGHKIGERAAALLQPVQ